MFHGSNIFRWLLVLLLMLYALWISLRNRIRQLRQINPGTQFEIMKQRTDLARQIYDIMLLEGMTDQQAQYALAQSAFETGNWTSKIFIENHNLFGMKFPKIRETTAIGEKYGHAVYNSVQDSVRDYILYLKYFDYPEQYNSAKEFVNLLKEKGYFESDLQSYIEGVQHYLKDYFKYNFA